MAGLDPQIYPPPITGHGGGGKATQPCVAVTLRVGDYNAALDFYTKLFSPVPLSPVTYQNDPPTAVFANTFCLRGEGPGSANTDVMFYTASEDQLTAALAAVGSNATPEVIRDDQGNTIQIRAQCNDPDGNTVWVVYDVPVFEAPYSRPA